MNCSMKGSSYRLGGKGFPCSALLQDCPVGWFMMEKRLARLGHSNKLNTRLLCSSATWPGLLCLKVPPYSLR